MWFLWSFFSLDTYQKNLKDKPILQMYVWLQKRRWLTEYYDEEHKYFGRHVNLIVIPEGSAAARGRGVKVRPKKTRLKTPGATLGLIGGAGNV